MRSSWEFRSLPDLGRIAMPDWMPTDGSYARRPTRATIGQLQSLINGICSNLLKWRKKYEWDLPPVVRHEKLRTAEVLSWPVNLDCILKGWVFDTISGSSIPPEALRLSWKKVRGNQLITCSMRRISTKDGLYSQIWHWALFHAGWKINTPKDEILKALFTWLLSDIRP
jgi:hypothetical protein